ncbi:MAG: phage portal protein, partial [Candidatus Hodarchaeales archaeon]
MPENKFDLVGPVFELSQAPSRKASEYLTAHKSWVYSAVTLIAREVSQIKLHLYRKKYKRVKGEMQPVIDEVYDHEAKSILYYVNDFMTFGQFVEITQTYLDLVGECGWALLRNNGKIEEIWPLRPDWIEIQPSKEKYIENYWYYPGGSFRKVRIEPEDMIFLKYLNPVSAYRGKGGVQAAAMAIDIDEFSSEWNRTFFYNAALPYIFFYTDKAIGEQEAKRLMEMWRSKFEGRKNAHKVAFLGKGLKPEVVGGNLKDLDFITGKKYLRDEILATFHTSKANLGVVEDVNRANQEASDARFKAKVIKPRMISLCYYLNEFYLRNWPNEDLFFDFEDPVPEDKELKLKVYENGLKNGWLTINEVREKENLPPVEGGDNIYLPYTLQPVGGVKKTIGGLFSKKKEEGVVVLRVKKKTKQEKIKDSLTMPIPPRRLRDIRAEMAGKKIAYDLVKMVVNLMKLKEDEVKKLKTKEQVKAQLTKEGKEIFWRSMVAKTDVQEQAMRGYLINLWEDQKKEVFRRIESATKAVKIPKSRVSLMLFDLNEENKKWISNLGNYIKEVVRKRGADIFDFLGMPRELDLTTRTAVRFLKKEGVKFIKSANETTREKLRRTLAEGVEKGEGIPELKRRVTQVFDSAVKYRAENIARTEVIRATNFATNEAYKQSGIVVGKEWLTALDERTCPFCQAMDGKIIDVNKDFFKQGDSMSEGGRRINFEYGNVAHPPLHPGCRCTLIPV